MSVYSFGTPRTVLAQLTTANTNLDGSGSPVTLAAGAASPGSLVMGCRIKSTGNVTKGKIRIFYYDGTNTRLIDEIDVDPKSVSGAYKETWQYDWVPPWPIKLASASAELRGTTHISETFNVMTSLGDL